MTQRAYPECYLETNSSEQCADLFADHIVSLRSFLLRVFVVFAILMTAWRIQSGFAPYASTITASWVINLSALACLAATFKWPFGHPLLNVFVRYSFCLVWLIAGLMMVSSAGYAPLWVFCAILCCLIIAGDDPNHPSSWRHWIGTSMAVLATLLAFVLLPKDSGFENATIFNRWQISFSSLIAVTAYAWHSIFSNQRLLQREDKQSQEWRQSVQRLVEQQAYFNPFLLVLVVISITFALSMSSLLTSPDQSIIVTMLTNHLPFSLLLLLVFIILFMAAIRSEWLVKIAPAVFISCFVLAVMMVFNNTVNTNNSVFFAPIGFLYFMQPNASRRRWLLPIIYGVMLSVYIGLNLDVMSMDYLVISIGCFVCFTIAYDQLRVHYLNQLAVLEKLDNGIGSSSIVSAQSMGNVDQWIHSKKLLWVMIAACVVIVAAMYASNEARIRSETKVLKNLIEQELRYEIRHKLNELNLLARDDDIDMLNALTIDEAWCGVWPIAGALSLPEANVCGLDSALLQEWHSRGASSTEPTIFYYQQRAYMLSSHAPRDEAALVGVFDLSVLLKTALHIPAIHRHYSGRLLFNDPMSGRGWALDMETWLLSEVSAVDSGESPWMIEVTPNSQLLMSFWIETSRLLVILCLFVVGIRHIFVSRSNVSRLSTDIVQHERELAENRLLRQEISDALYRAEQANKAKDNFLGVIGHEIRTPLNSVMGMLQALSMKPLPDDAKHLVKNAYNGSTMLLNLVNDVLDFNKLQTGTLTLENRPFALGSFIDLYQQQYATAALEKGLTFKCEIHGNRQLVLQGDDIRLGQVLANLLSNAVKFTQTGGIMLHVDVVDNGEGVNCSFKVMDTGIGIDQKFLPHVFDPFKQYDMSIKRQYRGAGLGLSIAKHLVEMMDGHIDVFSRVGRGSTFIFNLPMALADDQQTLATESELDFSAPKEIYKGKRILVVDDDVLNLEVITELMEPFGVIVDCAQNANESFDFLAQHGKEYACVLMDHQMPDMTGLEQTYRIRESYSKDELPIVILTADLTEKVIELADKAGTNESVSKPITLRNLRRLLDNY